MDEKILSPNSNSNCSAKSLIKLNNSITLEKYDSEEARFEMETNSRFEQSLEELDRQLLESQEHQLHFLKTKYTQAIHEKKRLEFKRWKEAAQFDMLRAELGLALDQLEKTKLVKSKLENLSRDLHKENRQIQEEAMKLVQNEQAKREELSAKFDQTITEMTHKLEASQEAAQLKEKLETFKSQYELREKHYNSVLETKDLEIKLANAKYLQEAQISQDSLSKAEALKQEFQLLAKSEQDLKKQLALYVDKFKQVEETLVKSNELFSRFREEMEQTQQRMNRLESENKLMKQRCEAVSKNILQLADEKSKQDKEIETLRFQKNKLEALCRCLRAEYMNNVPT